MTISARNWAWDVGHFKSGEDRWPIKPQEKLTLIFLAEMENAEEGYAYPSQETIAKRTGQGIRTVKRHIATLAECGAFTIETRRHTKSGKWLNNVYILNVPGSYRLNDPEWMRNQA